MLLIPAINLTSRVIIRRVNTVDGVRKNTVDVRSQQVNKILWILLIGGVVCKEMVSWIQNVPIPSLIRHTNTNSKFFDQIIMFKVKIAHKNTKLFVFYGNDQPSVRRTQQGGGGRSLKYFSDCFVHRQEFRFPFRNCETWERFSLGLQVKGANMSLTSLGYMYIALKQV